MSINKKYLINEKSLSIVHKFNCTFVDLDLEVYEKIIAKTAVLNDYVDFKNLNIFLFFKFYRFRSKNN